MGGAVMPQGNTTLEVANFVLHFGDDLVLLDRYTEIVKPAFLKARERSFGDTTYLFHRVKEIDLSSRGNREVGIAGRIIKKTRLVREQVFDGRRLIQDHREMDTAPSAIFLLLLSSHRLLYSRETSGAPG